MPEIVYKTNSRSKSIRIKIDSASRVIVTSPKWTPKFISRKFVEAQQTWIETQLTKVKFKKNLHESEISVTVFGKKYQKIKLNSDKQSYGVSIRGDQLKINNFGAKKFNHKILLDRFLKNTAEKYIVPRTHALAKKMGVSFSRITLRQQKTRWGSCSSRGTLNFNWRLVHYLPNIIDYVIIHELSHLEHMNHSRDFWSLVRKYDPAYLEHRGFLKRCGMSLG